MRPRERLLAGAVAILGLGWMLDAVVLAPASAWLRGVAAETARAAEEASAARALIDRQARILADWRGRHAAGLLDDEAAARYRLQQAVAAGARDSGLVIDSVGGGQLVHAGRDQAFDLLRITVSGQGSLEQAQAFVAAIESASMPARIERCELAAPDAKQDRLDVALTVSTRIAPAASRAGRQVPEGTPAWRPGVRDAGLDQAILVARPFLADRSRPRPAAAPSTPDETPVAPGGWALVGIVGRQPGAVAFLREIGGSGEQQLGVGDACDGAVITAIDESGVHFGPDRVVLVGSDLNGRAIAAPAAVRPSTVVPASTSPSPAPPAATGGSDREAILQRLRQQRNRHQ